MARIFRKTKLVCTIGPASQKADMIERLIRAGMNVARLNLSHGTLDNHAAVIKTVRDISCRLDLPIGILMDLPGAKLRTGGLKMPQVLLKAGDRFTLTGKKVLGDQTRVSVSFAGALESLQPGNFVFLNDGAIRLKVQAAARGEAECRVLAGGVLTPGRGVNVPGVKLNIPSGHSKEQEYVAFGVEHGVDFIAVSFVRAAGDILRIRRFLQARGGNIPLIAKIEKHEAVADIDSIIAAADGVMVARGDLGVEIPLERVPLEQKTIIQKCNQAGKPVVVATQMLESMMNAERPTRAEVSDVANAIFDGADAVMLSGETAVGKYPVETVKIMARIAAEAEKALPYERLLQEKSEHVAAQTDDAISYAACHIGQRLGAACIVAYTSSGSTALRVSRYRPHAPILALTPNDSVARKLALSWGVHPRLAPVAGVDMIFREANQAAYESGMARKGDITVITAGIPVGVPGRTNLIRVQRLE